MVLPPPGGGNAGGRDREGEDIGPQETEYGRAIRCDATNSGPMRGLGATVGDPCPPPSLRALAEGQNRSRRDELRDRILSPEDRCPHPHYPCRLRCSHQGEAEPIFVPPPAWGPPCQAPGDPALEGVQGRLHLSRQDPGLRPEEEDLLCHGDD